MIYHLYQAAIDAYHAYLEAGGHKVAMCITDAGASECYIVTYGRGTGFLVHTLIEGAAEIVDVQHFHNMASAIAFATKQAVHTFAFACDTLARHSTPEEHATSEDDLVRKIAWRMSAEG